MASTTNVIIEDSKFTPTPENMPETVMHSNLWFSNPSVGYILFSSFFFAFVNYATKWTIPLNVLLSNNTKRRDPQEAK